MKPDRKTRCVMQNRKEWLKGWVKLRKHDLKSKRKEFLFIYYCTIRVLLGACSEELWKKMLHNMNRTLTVPLKEDQIESIVSKVEKRNGYIFRNDTIVKMLGITPDEAEQLKIDENRKAKEKRAHNAFLKYALEETILKEFEEGLSMKEIVVLHKTECSKSTIERILKEPARQRKQERDDLILFLYDLGRNVKEIARFADCSLPTVRKVIRKKPSDFTITERKRDQEKLSLFSIDGGKELFSLYKTETECSTLSSYDHAFQKLTLSKNNILLTGAAGTAKSTLLKKYVASLSQEEQAKTLLVAPTGMAAMHIKAQTIHKAFGLPVGVLENVPITDVPKTLLKYDRIIIDEISMVRIDTFHRIISMIKFIEQKQQKTIQVIVCGDFGQIEPVATKEDKILIQKYFPSAKGVYAFHSELWDQMQFEKILLTYVFRQNDSEFVEKLMEIKYGYLPAIEYFNNYRRIFEPSNPIYICARNKDVDRINAKNLARFPKSALVTFTAKEKNVSEQDVLPCPKVLQLAKGMRVMMICNTKDYKNGNLGTIQRIGKDSVEVMIDDQDRLVKVKRHPFHLDSGGTYEQFPLVLGYAITVNKSQGCTFPEIMIVPGFFAAGQLYVALSRVSDPQGLYLKEKIRKKDLIVDVEALKMTV